MSEQACVNNYKGKFAGVDTVCNSKINKCEDLPPAAPATAPPKYRLCYDNVDPLDAKCVTKDYDWIDSSTNNPKSPYTCPSSWTSIESQCTDSLQAYLAKAQAKEGPVCCIPPTAKKKDIACQDITADYNNDAEVNDKCTKTMGGNADDYAFSYQGTCAEDTKDCGTGAKVGSKGGAAGTGSNGGAGSDAGAIAIPAGSFHVPNLTDPLAGVSAPGIIGRVIRGALSVVGTIGLVLLIYAGIMWMTAAGNEERVKSSVNIIIWTILGLVLIFASSILVQLVFSAIK